MRRKDRFDFKQFSVAHDRCAMKVGTDAALLGAWANVLDVKSILDIGTGSGVIALMLAQRTQPDVLIDAVEYSEPDAAQARENVGASPWPYKVAIHACSIQEFQSAIRYDAIVSNPPFFINSALPPNHTRQTARHTLTLTQADLLNSVARLLKPTGRFMVVLPTVEGSIFKAEAATVGLHVRRELLVFARKGKPQERSLLEFGFESGEADVKTLVLLNEGEQWTPEYKSLMSEFYLHA